MEERKHTTKQALEALKIPKERFWDWVSRGFVTLSHPTPGRGHTALFDREDLYFIALFRDALRDGFPREIASQVVAYAKELIVFEEGIPRGDIPRGAEVYGIVVRVRIDQETGESLFGVNAVGEGPIKLDPVTGHLLEDRPGWDPILIWPSYGSIVKEGGDMNDPWDKVHWFNFKRLRERIDAALFQQG